MAGIVDSVQQVSTTVGEISAAAAQQSAGIASVTQTMTRLDDVTRHRIIRELIGLLVDDLLATTSARIDTAAPKSLPSLNTMILRDATTTGGAGGLDSVSFFNSTAIAKRIVAESGVEPQ